MNGPEPEYVAARRVLLDALEALGVQRQAIIIVGAQAVYLHIGDQGIAVAPYTTDADLAISPAQLADDPLIEELLRNADFTKENGPGVWKKAVQLHGVDVEVPVDLMVPDGFAPEGSGRRSVNLPPHDRLMARRAVGLEGTILDNDLMRVPSLDETDDRSYTVRVAGPASLVIAKVHKLRDRINAGSIDRIDDKDAADVYRLMVSVRLDDFLVRLRPLLEDPIASHPTREGIELLHSLFGARASQGVRMAWESLRVSVRNEQVADVCTTFVRQVRQALGTTGD